MELDSHLGHILFPAKISSGFLKYMEEQIYALPGDVVAFPIEDIESAIKSGKVKKAPVSVHRDAGHVYWLNTFSASRRLNGMCNTALPYCGSTVDVPLAGSVESLTAGKTFDQKTAAVALVVGRERGKLKEYVVDGVSYFVVPKAENDPRVRKFLGLA